MLIKKGFSVVFAAKTNYRQLNRNSREAVESVISTSKLTLSIMLNQIIGLIELQPTCRSNNANF